MGPGQKKEGERGEEKRSWCNIRLLYNLFVVSLEKENEREREERQDMETLARSGATFQFPETSH